MSSSCGGLAERVVVGHERLVGAAHEPVRELGLPPRVVRQQRVERLLEQGVGLDVRAAAGLALGPPRRAAEARRASRSCPSPRARAKRGSQCSGWAMAKSLRRRSRRSPAPARRRSRAPRLIRSSSRPSPQSRSRTMTRSSSMPAASRALMLLMRTDWRADVAVAARRHDALERRQVEVLEPLAREAAAKTRRCSWCHASRSLG